MSYVIVKGKKKLHAFHGNDAPVGTRKKKYHEEKYTIGWWEYEDVFLTRYMFKYYKDSCTRFRTEEEALRHLAWIKAEIIKNRDRYETFLEGSTDKLLKYADTLRVIEDDRNLMINF